MSISKKCPDIPYHKILAMIRSYRIEVRDTAYTARKYVCNSNYFSTIDSEEKAYWLGFIYADGYLSKTNYRSNILGISLSVVDKGHLEKFRQAIGFTGNILTYRSCSGYSSKTEYARITIRDQQLCDDLEAKGVYYHKTQILRFPDDNIVPEAFIPHFIRGYFDGEKRHANQVNNYSLDIGGNKQVISIMEYLYSNASVYLERKRDKYNDFLQLYNSRPHR